MKIHVARTRVVLTYSLVDRWIDLLDRQDDTQRHVGTPDPGEADVIIYPDCHLLSRDWRLTEITESDTARRYPEKVAVYDERDTPWCRYPGIYASMPAERIDPRWQVAGSYIFTEDPAGRIDGDPDALGRDLLFSFIGGRTHPCRDGILSLDPGRAHIESSRGFIFYEPTSDRFAERRRNFAEVMFRSNFVLCPRGQGTSSIRLYETLAAGRAPVIISDDWMPPAGPDWESFSIRWPEGRIGELPGALAEREADAAAMGRRAREAYDTWFAPTVVVTRQLDQLERLLRPGGFAGFPAGGGKDGQYRRARAANVRFRYHSLRTKVADTVKR